MGRGGGGGVMIVAVGGCGWRFLEMGALGLGLELGGVVARGLSLSLMECRRSVVVVVSAGAVRRLAGA